MSTWETIFFYVLVGVTAIMALGVTLNFFDPNSVASDLFYQLIALIVLIVGVSFGTKYKSLKK